MDSNITDQQDFSGDEQLTEPHFDEEATLLSARQVVPLDEIRTEQRLGRRLSFGIAIISSLVLGALGAKLIYRSGSGEQPTAVVSDVARGGAGSIGGPVQSSAIVEGVAGITSGNLADATATEAKQAQLPEVKDGSMRKEATRLRPSPDRPGKRFDVGRADRERERRKEARAKQSNSANGLSRIREIFEGPPRP
jgi:hypothetical protein